MSDKGHLLPFTAWYVVLRGTQLCLAIVIMGLAGYGINYYPFSGGFDGVNLNMYTAIETIITVVYILVATFALPIAYNYWAILGLDVLGVIFWLVSFALLASEVSTYKSDFDSFTTCYYVAGICFDKRASSPISKRDTTIEDYYHSMAATAGLGAVEFVLFIITLTFTSLWLHRHRKSGGHCMPMTNNGSNNSPSLQRQSVAVNDENRAPSIPVTNVVTPENNQF